MLEVGVAEMSFCEDVKKEIIANDYAAGVQLQLCCRKAEMAGIIRTYGKLSVIDKNGCKIRIVLNKVEYMHASRLKQLIHEEYPDVAFTLRIYKNCLNTEEMYRKVELFVEPGGAFCEDVCIACIGGEIYYERYFRKHLKGCCLRSYLKGCFIISGLVNDPDNSYHLSITFRDGMVCEEATEMLQKFELTPKIGEKGGKPFLYFKDSQDISDFLKVLGAAGAVLKLENVVVMKDVINRTNRAVNCDSANLDRIVKTGINQASKLMMLKERGAWDELAEPLRELAEIRIKNPEASLSELGEMLSEPLGKSGVNHRLRKLMEIAG